MFYTRTLQKPDDEFPAHANNIHAQCTENVTAWEIDTEDSAIFKISFITNCAMKTKIILSQDFP
jgi:hypothetical protein